MEQQQNQPLSFLSAYHAVVIEGMGGGDPRDPSEVATQITSLLEQRWRSEPPQKPVLIVTQGDPPEPSGISAITLQAARQLGVDRGVVCLDEDIADYHAPNADRRLVRKSLWYSDLAQHLERLRPGIMDTLERSIDRQIGVKNEQRSALGKPPLKSYFRDFALLQEVTKGACARLCSGLTVVQTAPEVYPFSVTSFYTVGLELGLVDSNAIVAWP